MTSPSIPVMVKRLPHNLDLPLPDYSTIGSVGADILAAVTQDIILSPFARALIPTGLKIGIPTGYEIQVRPRSGLALKHGITCLNTPGTIDSDYRGEVGVILINLSDSPFTISRAMRIAQLVIAPVYHIKWREITVLDDTDRGTRGFGSTGL